MSSKKVLVILSSVRDGRHADKVGNAVMNHLKGISNLEAEILGEFCIFIFPLSLCSENFKMGKVLTLSKFDQFTATQFLCEIKFGKFKQSKNIIFGNFKESEH